MRTSIALLDASGDSLQIFALEDQAATLPVGKVMPVDGSILGLAVRERRVVLMTGAEFAQSELIGVKNITGMQELDHQAAGALLKAAPALRLLGFKTRLSGVRAEVAQTLIGLGIGLDALVTRGSLQSAIAHALAQTA